MRVEPQRQLNPRRQPVKALSHLWTPLAPQGFSSIAAVGPILAVAIYPAFNDDAVVRPW
jgi:hypothetical protein